MIPNNVADQYCLICNQAPCKCGWTPVKVPR